MNELTIVFGYSENPERYSYKAFHLLKEFEHSALAFNPRIEEFSKIPSEFHTLTMYVNEQVSSNFIDKILNLNFKRIIFNPGAENSLLEQKCQDKGIEVVHGCTLVMLKTDQF